MEEMTADEKTNADVWNNLSEGDKIQFETSGSHDTKKPHTVSGDGPDELDRGGGLLAVEGPGGAGKLMTQNKHDEDSICIMSLNSMSDKGEWVSNLRVVGEE